MKVDTNAMRRQNEMNKKMVQPVKKAMIKAILHKNFKELWCTRSSAFRAVASPRTSRRRTWLSKLPPSCPRCLRALPTGFTTDFSDDRILANE